MYPTGAGTAILTVRNDHRLGRFSFFDHTRWFGVVSQIQLHEIISAANQAVASNLASEIARLKAQIASLEAENRFCQMETASAKGHASNQQKQIEPITKSATEFASKL